MKKLYIFFVTLFITLFFFSCQKEISWKNPEKTQCKIITGYYYGGSGGLNDSVVFTYTGDNVTRAENRDYYVLYYYTGNNITVRKTYEKPGDLLVYLDSISYDNSNRITRLINWEYPGMVNPDTTDYIYDFNYQGGSIKKVVETMIIPDFYSDTSNWLFTTNASGNIESIFLTNYDQTVVWDSLKYFYNTDPNYFQAVHPHFFLFDRFFQLHAGLIPHFAYFYSHNNVTGFDYYGNVNYPITYRLDSLNNNVTGIDMGGFEYMKYKYECTQP
jgi:hypothetical protein